MTHVPTIEGDMKPEGKPESPQRILGIDPGTHCGFALLESDRVLASGEWNLTPSRHESSGMRFIKFERSLAEVLYHLGCDAKTLVAYEEVRRHLGTDAAHIYGGIIAVLQSKCIMSGIEYFGIPVGTVKKQATGKGNASKEDMIAAARKHWPHIPISSENQADALWIAETARRLYFAQSDTKEG